MVCFSRVRHAKKCLKVLRPSGVLVRGMKSGRGQRQDLVSSVSHAQRPLMAQVILLLCCRSLHAIQHNLLGMAAVAQLKGDPKYSAVHELLHIFSVEKLEEYMAFHKVCRSGAAVGKGLVRTKGNVQVHRSLLDCFALSVSESTVVSPHRSCLTACPRLMHPTVRICPCVASLARILR